MWFLVKLWEDMAAVTRMEGIKRCPPSVGNIVLDHSILQCQWTGIDRLLLTVLAVLSMTSFSACD